MNLTRDASPTAARRRFGFALVALLATGAAFTHAARHWLVVPMATEEARAAASQLEPRPDQAGPLASFALPASERMRFVGSVVDRLVAGSYTYLEIDRGAAGRAWVVTLSSSAGASLGAEQVSVVALGYAPHFASRRLGRSFEGLYFAVVRPS